MNNKLYLFNPFAIKDIKETELQKMYYQVFDGLLDEPNTMYDYSTNIEIYSNLAYICGEIIARLTRDIIELKTTIEIKKAKQTTEARKLWDKEVEGKQPAMSYFEALGIEFCKEDIGKLADKECSVKRFKNAYDSLEEKINALKRKCESIKFEEGFNRNV